MTEFPLLIFPKPENTDRTKQERNPNLNIHKPNTQRQIERLSPKFQELQTIFETQKAEIQHSMIGLELEQVLVMEIIGSIENFLNAVKKIEGLEWLAEIESDEIEPDEDYYNEKNPEIKLTGRLYLVMTNQRALEELLSLWKKYKENPDIKFKRGLGKFKELFENLKDIRRWDVKDRLIETGVLESWKEDVKAGLIKFVLCEIELWFRQNSTVREQSTKQVTNLVEEVGGRVLTQAILETIAYHALLVELPAKAIQEITENPSTKLVKCENIMFFRPSGQMRTREKPLEGNLETIQVKDMPLPQGKPILALLDGLPLVNHDLLKERLIIDDPDNFEKNYLSEDRIHGTAMASLIIHGDLNREDLPLNRPIYVRPILKPEKNLNNNTNEIVPKDYLIVDLIHRAVKRIFEGEGEEDPVAPTVKIINFSVGDSSRQFTQTISPLARLLDWLSVKYNVLFIVSTGNYDSDISLGISRDEFESLKRDKLKLEKKIIEFLYKDIRNRRLLSPAETINGLSIGALHFDHTKECIQTHYRIDPYKNLLPSPISAFGSGYRRAIKPDFIYCGGRQLYNDDLLGSLKPVSSLNPPGNKSASPNNSSGELNATSYSCGTSNATALTSRAAASYYETLQEIFYEQAQEQDFSSYEVPLVKAMLVHSCSWGEVGSKLEEILKDTNSTKIRDSKQQIRKWIGYGIANFERVLSCTKNRVTLLGFGELSEEKAHVFSLPLPPSLNSQAILRRLIVTLAWLSPISPKTQKYRIAHLWFEINGTPLVADRKECSAGKDGWSAVRRGTVQHEIFEGQNAEVFSDEDKIQIKVNCRSETEKLQKLIPYGLVVSLEVEEGLFVSIYQEIREKIQPKIKVPQRV